MKKYNLSISLVVFLVLFLGAGIIQILDLKSSKEQLTLFNLINPSIKLMVVVFFFWTIKRKIKFYFEETAMLISIFAYAIICFFAERSANLSILINVFFSLAILSLLLKNGNSLKKSIFWVVLLYYFSDSSLAIIERILQTNFIGPSQDSLFLDDSLSSVNAGFRSASIHSHPLQGALMISIVMSFIYITDYKPQNKIALLFVGFVALFSFNTRSSIVFWAIMILLYIIKLIIYAKPKYKFLGGIAVAFVALIAFYLLNHGWAGRLIELSLFDENSAQVRIDVLSVINDFKLEDFLLGVSKENGEAIFKRNDIFIMENYWISYVMNWGIPFTCWLVYCSYKILKSSMVDYPRLKKFFPIATFLLISSTNNSMMTGVPALLLMISCFYGFKPSNRT